MKKGFGSQEIAFAMRGVIQELVVDILARDRPLPMFGRVEAIQRGSRTCDVVFPGDEDSVRCRFYATAQPTTVGSIVRVEGRAGNTYVTEAINGFEWHDPEYLNDWVEYGTTGTYQQPQYRMQTDGSVRLRGLVKDGTLNAPAFILPVGYRPSRLEVFSTLCAGNLVARCEIESNGEVTLSSPSSTVGWYSLSGISFEAA
jgi:hypothetical protein